MIVRPGSLATAISLLLTAQSGYGLEPGSSGPSAAAPPAVVELALDAETALAGVGVACTGIGGSKTDRRWLGYPVRIEFANARHEHEAGEILTLASESGATIFTVSCDGPWLLLKLTDRLPRRVTAHLTDLDTKPQTAVVAKPARGQVRVVLTFPDAQ